MIDWAYVATNSLWILGLSIILAAFSYHDWLVHETRRRRRDLFRTASWRLPVSTGMMLFCLGLGLGRDVEWWERTLWGSLVVWFARQGAVAFLEQRKTQS